MYRAPIRPDGTLGPEERIINDLPDGGQHPNRTLAFGPDEMLYISVGSSCNACNETNPEHAALLIGTYELEHHLEIPYKVVINEAVELTKSFGGIDGHKYVNGVLDKLAAQIRTVETGAARGA